MRACDTAKLRSLGFHEQIDPNFKIEVEKNMFYEPILVAACIGNVEVLELLFQNRRAKAEVCDQETGVNAFWFAAYYGHGGAVSFLANKGLNVFVKHN